MQGITVYQRPGRKTFYVIFCDPLTGERVFRSSGIPVSDPQGKLKAYAFARQHAQSGITPPGGRDQERWDAWVPQFLHSRFAKSPKTLTSYLGAWKFLAGFFHEHGIKSPRVLTYQHALDFAAWRESKKKKASGRYVSRNTTLHNVKVLSRLMREAVRRGFAAGNPWYKVTDDLPADATPEKPEYTDADIAKVRAELTRRSGIGRPSDWMPIAFEIALAQGCRLGATAIPMHKIDFERWTIRFAEKGGQDFTVPVNPTLRPLLLRLRDEGRAVTCELPRFASRIFSRVLKNAGLQAPAGMGNHTFHSTRVTLISRGARAGISEQKMMRVVHHGSWAVHKRYTKLLSADVADVYPALALPPPDDSLLERHGAVHPAAPGTPARAPD